MDDKAFDHALLAAAFERAGQNGWSRLSIVQVARDAGLPLDRARQRFPGTGALLMRFGLVADQAALAGTAADGPVRDRLFDAIMRRLDVLQAHRSGMLALLRWLPTQPATALLLGASSLRSMGWMLEASGVPAAGVAGALRTQGLLAVWLWTVRSWRDDASQDLAATMAALDRALDRAEQAEGSFADLGRRGTTPSVPEPPPSPDIVPPTAPAGDFNVE